MLANHGTDGKGCCARGYVQRRHRSDPLRQLRELPSPNRRRCAAAWRRSAPREGGPAATSELASPKPSAKAGSSDDPLCVAGAPFSVLDYGAVRRYARAISSAVQRRAMPPWLPEPGHGEFAGERRLRDDQIALIAKWVESGAPEGNPADAPKPPTFSGGWQLGTPDLVLTLPEAYVLQPGGQAGNPRRVPQLRHSGADHHDALRARRRVPRRSPTGAAPRGRGHRSRAGVARARSCRAGSRFRGDGRRSGVQRVRLVAGQGAGDGAVRQRVDARSRCRLDPAAPHDRGCKERNGAAGDRPVLLRHASDAHADQREARGARDRHSRRRAELRRGGQLRAPGRRRGGEHLSARTLSREGDARNGDASRRFAEGSAVDSPVGLSLAGPVSLSIAGVPPAGHAAVDAVHLRQLRGESEQPSRSAAARAIGTALDRRDGPALDRGRAAPRRGRGGPQRRFRPSLTARRHRVGRAGRPARSAGCRRAQRARDEVSVRRDALPTRGRSSKRRCAWIRATRRRAATSGSCCRRRGISPRG